MSQVLSLHEAGKGSAIAFHLGKWSMHPVYGLPILLAVLYLVYQFVGVLGAGDAVGFLEETVFGEYLNPWAAKIVHFVFPVPFIQELLIGDYGLITMALTYAIAIVLPIVGFFFIAFGILEDSGYLPRLAVMVNRIFKIMGLNGKGRASDGSRPRLRYHGNAHDDAFWRQKKRGSSLRFFWRSAFPAPRNWASFSEW